MMFQRKMLKQPSEDWRHCGGGHHVQLLCSHPSSSHCSESGLGANLRSFAGHSLDVCRRFLFLFLHSVHAYGTISCVASVILCLSSCRSMVISFPFSAAIQPGIQRDHQHGCLPMAVRAGGKQSVYLEAAWSCCSAWLKGGHLTKLSFGIAGSLVCLVVILLRLRILFSCESHLLFR